MTAEERRAHWALSWPAAALPALTTALGMQTLRALFALLIYVLRDSIGRNAIEVGQLVLALFLTSFLSGFANRLLGPRRMLILSAGGLGLLRLAAQLWEGSALIDLYLMLAATVLLLFFFPTYLLLIRGGGAAAAGRAGIGVLWGLALDTAVHGAAATYDLFWQSGWQPLLATAGLVLAQWAALVLYLRRHQPETDDDLSFPSALVWLALGPFLFLQLLIFQNVARLAALSGWWLPNAYGWTLLSHVAGLALAALALSRLRRRSWSLVLILGFLLANSLLVPSWPTGWLAALSLFGGQLALAVLLVMLLAGLGASPASAGQLRLAMAYGLGMVLLVALSFLYYVGYDLPLPLDNVYLPAVAGLIVGVSAAGAVRTLPGEPVAQQPGWRFVWPVFLLLLLPAAQWLLWQQPAPRAGSGEPIRIMTYNLHNGFDPTGYLGMEAQAQVIAASEADIVVLQEVSRGWVINGSLDMLSWLSQRLEMPYHFAPTADPLWGNAILSRFPIQAQGMQMLPPADLPLQRGLIWAEVAVGDGRSLNVIGTHFHHPKDDASRIRHDQAQALLDYWQGQERTVILGDLNAQPGDEEIEMLRRAGLVEALAAANVEPGYTYSAVDPRERIDYIWLSADLAVGDVYIPADAASDHLAIVAIIRLPGR